jgi:hypothetical protein
MRPAAFSFAPEFAVRGASVVAFDRVRVTLSRTTGVAFDTVIAFPADSDSLHLVLTTPIDGASETLSLTLAMIDAAGDTVFRGGPVPVVLEAVAGGSGGAVSVPVRYTGVGANAKSVLIAPLSASVFFRDSVTLAATALDSSGQPIPGTPIAWRSLDTALAKVRADTSGRVLGGITRGVARIEASLPTGPADTALVTVQPVPAAIGLVSGGGQSGAVGLPLPSPVVVVVKAADSLPVQGVAVDFTVASGGGSVSKAADTTNASGTASTAWSLGTALGAQSLTAAVGLAPSLTVTAGATAIAGAPKQLAFLVQPPAGAVGVALAPAVQVVAQDSLGNTATTFTGNVTVAIGANPGSATLGGTLTVAAVAGVATFSNLALSAAGTGYTLVASATGLAGATSAAFSVTGGVPTQLAFVQQPSNTVGGAPISPAVTVQVRDVNGNLVPTATNAVTVAIGTNPQGGTLSGTTTVNAVAGVATFSGLSIDNVGSGYTLVANASGLAAATSAAFNIVAPAGVNAWINPAGGNWSVATNWSKGAVPVATDTVTITQSGTYTINLDVNGTFAKLTAGAPSGTQTLAVAADTLTAAGNATFAANTVVDLSGSGTIGGSGTLTLSGPFNWTGGNLGTGGGTLKVLAGAAATIAPSANVSLQAYTLELDGPTSWTGTAFINSGSGGTLRIGAGGVLTVSGDPTFSYNLGGAAPLLNNLGTINRTTSANAFVVNVPVSGTGGWNVQSGSINLQYGGTVSGAVVVSSGATLNLFTSAAALTFDGTSSITGAGTVSFGNGTTTVAGAYNVTGPTLISGGTANFNTASGSAASLALGGGTLSGTGLLNVSGAMTVGSGAFGASAGAGGTTRVLTGGTLSLAPTATLSFQGYTLELDGAGTWTGAQTVNSGSGAVLRVASGATLDIQGTPSFLYSLGGTPPAFNVLGTLTRSTNAGAAALTVPLNDSGAVSVTAGTLQLGGGGKSTGSISVATGDTLQFSGGSDTLAAASRISGAGTVTFSGGSVITVGSYSISGATLVAGGTAILSGANDTTAALTVGSGTLSGSGLLAVSGPMSWTGGNLGAASGAGGTLRVLPGGTLAMAPTAGVTLQGYTLELDGNGTWAGAQQVGTGSAAVLRVASGGTLAIQGNPTIAYTLGGAATLLDNQGTINRTAGAAAATIGVPFNQVGALNVDSGVVVLAGGGTLSGPVTEAPATLLQLGGGTFTMANKFAVTGPSGITQLLGGTLAGLTATDTAFFDNLQLQGGSVALSGGTIKTPYEAIWSGPAAVSGGTLYIPGSAGLAMSFTTGSPSLQNATILVASGGAIAWTGTTPLSSGSGAIVRILSGANASFSGAGGGYLDNLGGTASLLDNQGTLISAASSGSPGAIVISAPISNTGTIDVTSDTLRLSGGGTGTFPGTVSVVTGAVLELGGGSFTLGSPLNVGGSLLVSGGTLVTAGHPVAVTQNFATSGSGVLQMQSSADSLGVGGNASFGGGSTTGLLTAGLIDLKGNFAQSGNASSFAPSTAQRTRFSNGAGALQTVSFANPTQSFFDSLVVDRAFSPGTVELLTDARVNRGFLIQNSSALTGPTARLTIIGGTLQAVQSTTSPSVTPLVIEMQTAPLVGGAPVLVSPDTMVYDGLVATLPTGSGLVYKSLRVNTTGSLTSPGGVTYNGDLIVSSGTYTMNTGTDSVGGFLRTEGTGALSMQISNAPNLAVRDSAVFAGGPSNNLVFGTLRVGGNFVERGTGGQFAPTGTRVVLQKGTAGVETIQMADTVGSFFHDLVLNRPIVDTVRMLSNVQVQDSAIVEGSSVLASTTTEALKTPATGAVRVHSGGVLRPYRVEIGGWLADSAFLGGPVRISPDTAVFLGGADTITSAYSPLAWQNVRVGGGTLVTTGTVYNGNLIVSGGLYTFPGCCTGTDSVKGFLRTEGTGTLQLNSGDGSYVLVVRDSAVFAGGDETGLLVNSELHVGGDFVQRGLATSFQAGPNNYVYFEGSGPQNVTFASPGAGASGFGNLFIARAAGGASQPAGITLGSDIYVATMLEDSSTSATDSILGNGHTVNAGGVTLGSKFVMNNAQLVTNTTNVYFSGLTFRNMSPTVTQWTLNVPFTTGITVSGLNFQTPPTTGQYFAALMSAAGGNSMAVTGASPAASAMTGLYTRFNANGAVVVVWNGTQLP